MIADLKPYPAMEDSGVEWLGEVPVHWSTERLKSSMKNIVEQTNERRGADLYVALEHVEGWTGRIRHADPDVSFDSQVKYFRPGDVLFGKLRPYLAKVTRPTSDGVCVGEFLVLRPRHANATAAYMEQLLRSKPIVDAVNSSTFGAKMPRADWQFMGGMAVALPPLPEQAAIVRFLDHADCRIQRYIRVKQKLITLLEEQKRALIHQAVTGKVDIRTGQPYPAYKPSGVEWLGEVPEHWEVRRFKTICSMKSGDGITAMSIEPAGEYPVYGGNGLRGYTSSYTHDGNFALIGRQGALCGNVHIAQGRFWASEHAVVATVHSGHVLEWFGAILGVMNLNQYSIAAAQPGLSVERVLNLWLPVPPSEEQAVITTSIEQQTAGTDTAIDRARRETVLLQEYRTRLIADVVTGKLDVREAAARLPDDVEEPEPLDETDALIEGEEESTDDRDAVPEEAEV